MKNLILIALFFFLLNETYGQEISGTVVEKNSSGKSTGIPGVNIFLPGTNFGTTTNDKGEFSLIISGEFPVKLIVSFVGYQRDTIEFKQPVKGFEIGLRPSLSLKEIEIAGKRENTSYSSISTINTQIITSGELKKAACCNLSESFETNSTVDVNYADAVSGAKQIQVLGLDGIYTQILSENLPMIRGLMSPYGLSFIPGTWLESIQITKGTGSVVNGYEAMTGQINIELQKPEIAENVFVNLYAGDRGRLEGNLHLAHKFNERTSTMGFFHASNLIRKNDQNKDGFLDSPLYSQLNGFNRWKYSGKKFAGQIGLRILNEDRTGGQLTFDPEKTRDTLNGYGIGIRNRQIEVFTKSAFLFPNEPYKGLALVSTIRKHDLSSFFGLRDLRSSENSLYLNLIYQSIIFNSDHKFKTGVSYLYDDFKNRFNRKNYNRTESVPGIYGEYSFEKPGLMVGTIGMRLDYHNLYGLVYTPRLHMKFDLSEFTFLRLSAGNGFRVPNMFTDNPGLLASSRRIIILEDPLPERSWNYGLSLSHQFKLFGNEGSFNSDFFRTDFTNQFIMDFDRDQEAVYFYNITGKSYSNSFQAELSYSPMERLDLRTAYKRYDVKVGYMDGTNYKPFTASDRVMFNAGYRTKFDKWAFDYTLQWYGRKRIPLKYGHHEGQIVPTWSDPYFTMNAQITRKLKLFEFYSGVENLTNFMQHLPVIGYEKPFSSGFDASMIWGPVMGRVIYAGIRTKFK